MAEAPARGGRGGPRYISLRPRRDAFRTTGRLPVPPTAPNYADRPPTTTDPDDWYMMGFITVVRSQRGVEECVHPPGTGPWVEWLRGEVCGWYRHLDALADTRATLRLYERHRIPNTTGYTEATIDQLEATARKRLEHAERRLAQYAAAA